jgi:phosphate butyryltransferase
MRLRNRTFEQIAIGESAELHRLVTTDDLYGFAAVSGNVNPMNLPGMDIDGDGIDDGAAPAMFVAALISAVLGNILPGPGTLYRRQLLTMHPDRARAGDEVVCRVVVTGKRHPDVIVLDTGVHLAGTGAPIVTGEAEVRAPTVPIDRDGIDVPGLVVQRHRHFEALLTRARPLPELPTAVVCPDEERSLGGAFLAAKDGIISPILVGNAVAIRAAGAALGADLSGIEIIDAAGGLAAAERACSLVHEGRVAAVMKGHLHTDILLKPMLDRALGMRVGRRFTHVFVMDVPGQPEPILVTDAAINISPDLATKVDIVQNAIDLALSLGMDPRVGVLSAVETVNPAIQSSIDGALLSKMAERGQIRGGQVEGPLAMDNAIDIGAARIKGLKGLVAGRANILVVPGLDAGNMLVKQLEFISHAEGAGLVLGAKVPVILNSRSDGPMSRLASCAVAAIHHFAAARTGTEP